MKEIKCYAKINLILLIKQYSNSKQLHKIQSVFKRAIDVYDTINISVSKNNSDRIRYFQKNGLLLKIDNCIIEKSLQLLRDNKVIKDNKFYNIDVFKNIPIGSGMGGGSSDAANVIKFILKDNNVNLSKRIVNKIVKIGSDIPFFLYGYDLAIVKGYGEKVKQLKLDYLIKYQIVNPNINCETKLVYLNYKENKLKTKVSFKEQLQFLKDKKFDLLVNQLQKPCCNVYEKIKQEIDKLNSDIKESKYRISGSGSTLFRIIK